MQIHQARLICQKRSAYLCSGCVGWYVCLSTSHRPSVSTFISHYITTTSGWSIPQSHRDVALNHFPSFNKTVQSLSVLVKVHDTITLKEELKLSSSDDPDAVVDPEFPRPKRQVPTHWVWKWNPITRLGSKTTWKWQKLERELGHASLAPAPYLDPQLRWYRCC